MATQSDREIDWEIARLSGGFSASRRAAPAHQGSLRPIDWNLADREEGPPSERSEAVARDLANLEARTRPIVESLAPMALEAPITAPSAAPHAAAAPRNRPSRAGNAFWTATAGGMSILAVGLVAVLAVAPTPHPVTSVAAAARAPTLGVELVREGVPFAPRAMVMLDPVQISGDAPIAAVAQAPVARIAATAVAPSPAAIPPRMVIPPPAATAPIAGAELSRPAAAVAIAVAGRRASACLDASDPRATMPVSLTFAPSGRVTTATVDGGPFVGTSVGGCIARALRGATVGPFDGAPVTVHSNVTLR